MESLCCRRIRFLLVASVAIVVASAGSANADFIFGTPTNLGPMLNTSARDEEPGISADGLSLYYCSLRSGGYGGYDMWVTNRATTQDDWGPPVNLGSTVNSPYDDFSEDISADGLELYFGSNRPGGTGGYDIWVARRATTHNEWTTPVSLGPMVNSPSEEGCPSISDDGLELYFWSTRPGGAGSYDIWVSRRATIQDDWGMAENLGAAVNSSVADLCTDVSPDSLSLLFVSARPGGYGGNLGDLWMSRRPEIGDSWGPPINLGPMVNGSYNENGPCLSTDGSTLYFSSDRPGGSGDADMWQVSISPVVDFNSDGIVDIKDLLRLIESWGQNDPSVDIAPLLLGDGVVDRKDLEVLVSYWGQEIPDPLLVAHWRLDEAEGIIAFDSAGTSDGVAVGDPVWQPAGGRVGGALELDGVDDCVTTEFVCDPSKGPLSVFAWIQGGAPGQVIVSQEDGANWLMAGALDGTLATELVAPAGRIAAPPLISGVLITDGLWHRVAFTWDGSNRRLYVDDALAAEDRQSSLANCSGGLNIGCGEDMTPGSFWSGLIDDVRIYNRVVEP